MSEIKISIQKKSYETANGETQVIQNLLLTIEKGSFVSIIGPSGCGKSTLLKIILGIDNDFQGNIKYFESETQICFPDVSIVFQDLRLFPWLNVFDNIAFGLPKNASKNEKDSRVHELLEMVGLLENKFSWVKELSGGMKQRVAIARSLVNIPKLLLLDEPFRELDAFTKDILQNDLKKIINSRNVTTILVTHDIDEAIFLSDTLHILSNKPSTLLKTYNLKGLKKSKNSDDFLKIRKEVYNELF